MRIPFLAGWMDRARESTRLVVPTGETPTPIKGPWVLMAVVQGGPESGGAQPSAAPSAAASAAASADDRRNRSSTSRAEPDSSDAIARSTPPS